MARHPESRNTNALCSAVNVVYNGTVTAPRSRDAMSAIGHSGRFSLRMPTRSPGRIPQPCRARAVRATLRPNPRDEMGSHCPPSRWSMILSRLRSTAAKKMSFRVEMLIVSLGPGPVGARAGATKTPNKLYCFAHPSAMRGITPVVPFGFTLKPREGYPRGTPSGRSSKCK